MEHAKGKCQMLYRQQHLQIRLGVMYKDACHSARQEQALEALSDLNQLAKSTGATDEVVAKLQASH